MKTNHTPEAITVFDALLTSIFERRTAVEEELVRMALGKEPMPDTEKLRSLARALGDPNSAEARAIEEDRGWPKMSTLEKFRAALNLT